MSVPLFSRYGSMGASSRVRYLRYLPYFEGQGIHIEPTPLFSNHYLDCLYSKKSILKHVLRGYLGRFFKLLVVRHYDLLIIEKELFPFLPAFAERVLAWLGVPYLVDFDDALFHRYDLNSNFVIRSFLCNKIDVVMRCASAVVVGNNYLGDRAFSAGAHNVVKIPTVVDDSKYLPAAPQKKNGKFVIGWIGTPKTSKYLVPLIPIFRSLSAKGNIKIVAIGARQEDFPDSPIEIGEWTADTEITSIQQFDLGIMPLPDSPWERGKCGYKLIQYMACEIPVVASPVGVNAELVEHGVNGFLAETNDEWLQCFMTLLEMSEAKRHEMGRLGRAKVEAAYSLNSQAPKLMKLIKQYAKEASDDI